MLGADRLFLLEARVQTLSTGAGDAPSGFFAGFFLFAQREDFLSNRVTARS